MANTFITMNQIAKRGLATLVNEIVLAGLVYRDYDPEFTGKQGDTITVKTPAVFAAKEFDRDTGIELQDATEGSFPVVLDTLLDVSFAVTAEDLTLELENFSEQLLNPAMEALAQDIDGRLAEALVDQATTAGHLGDGVTSPNAAFRGARAILGRNKLPLANRYAVLSPEGVSDALSDELIVQADKSGSTDGLREASIGRVFGFDTYESQVFGHGPGDKGQADGIAFHKDAVALVSRTLEKPEGVAAEQVSIASYKGIGVRVVKAYDITKKQDVVSVDTLIGVQSIRAKGSVELTFGQGS